MGDLLQPWHLIVLSFGFGLFLIVPAVFYILSLQGALNKCSATARTLEPAMLWLLLLPIVNLVWHFFVVIGMANSLENEFKRREAPIAEPKPGQPIGLAMCICGACSIIPILGAIAGLASLVLWIVYWVKIGEYSRLLSGSQATPVAPLGNLP
jgi:hypothetical protein